MVKSSCAVVGCTNNTCHLSKWQKEICAIHDNSLKGKGTCVCLPPFVFFPFPKEGDDLKERWEECVNRIETVDRTVRYGKTVYIHIKDDKWRANPTDRICSKHFVDGRPTDANPLPTLYMSPQFPPSIFSRKRNGPQILTRFTATPKVARIDDQSHVNEGEIEQEEENIELQIRNQNTDWEQPSSDVHTFEYISGMLDCGDQ